jgi:hypothetical protein
MAVADGSKQAIRSEGLAIFQIVVALGTGAICVGTDGSSSRIWHEVGYLPYVSFIGSQGAVG